VNLFSPNTDNFNNFIDKAKYLMAWRITFVFFIVFSALTVNYVINNSPITVLIFIAIGSSFFSLIYLYFTKKYIHIYWFFVLSGLLLIHYSINSYSNILHYEDFFWLISIILVAFIGLGKEYGIVCTIINALGITYFFIFNLNYQIEVIEPYPSTQIISDIIEIFLSLFGIGYLLHQHYVFNEYFSNQLQTANTDLLKKNEENKMLLKEVHHRVKNNLQIITSLLRLQKSELKSDETKRHFNEAINRIMVMSLIHKKLYQEFDMANIEIKTYLNDLAIDVIKTSNMGHPIDAAVSSEIQKVGLKTIVPLGLLINELLSNSIKHAFLKKDGCISISLLKGSNKNEFILIYTDDGIWFDNDENYSSFGLGLIETLTEQLEGTYTRKNSKYTFTIKNLDHQLFNS
jgi:two-component sensor histidine kinase